MRMRIPPQLPAPAGRSAVGSAVAAPACRLTADLSLPKCAWVIRGGCGSRTAPPPLQAHRCPAPRSSPCRGQGRGVSRDRHRPAFLLLPMAADRIPEANLISGKEETAVMPDGGIAGGAGFFLNRQEKEPDWLADCSDCIGHTCFMPASEKPACITDSTRLTTPKPSSAKRRKSGCAGQCNRILSCRPPESRLIYACSLSALPVLGIGLHPAGSRWPPHCPERNPCSPPSARTGA